MPPIAPTQCQPLSSSAYTGYGISFQVFAAGYVPDGVSQAQLQTEVNAAVSLFGDATGIVEYLVSKGVISATGDEDKVVEIVAATMVLSALRAPASGWTCCMDSSNGSWWPYHPKYGWDHSQRCA